MPRAHTRTSRPALHLRVVCLVRVVPLWTMLCKVAHPNMATILTSHHPLTCSHRVSLCLWATLLCAVAHPIWNVTDATTPDGHKGIPPSETAAVKEAMQEGLVLVVSLWSAPANNM